MVSFCQKLGHFMRSESLLWRAGIQNSSIVNVVLALGSWRYCYREQDPTTKHIHKIAHSPLYRWRMYIWKNRVLSPYVNSLATRWHSGNLTAFYSRKAIRGKIWEDVRLLELVLQNNSPNSLVLALHRQLGTICSVLERAMSQQPNISARHYIGQCLPHTDSCTTKAQGSIWHWILVSICSSDICWKILSSWSRSSGPVTCLQDGH